MTQEATLLNEREQLILQAVVHTYITTADAVGSRSIAKRFGLDLSPASVRNVMADLEEAGYLQQLHTSSGRVPTDRGYRYYVNYLMKVQELTLGERARIECELSEKLNDADEIMRQTSHLLALVSHQAGIVEAPDEGKAIVRHVELVPFAPARAALIVADDYGRVQTVMVAMPETITDLPRLNGFMRDALRDIAVSQIASSLRAKAKTMMDEYQSLAEQALSVFSEMPPQRPGRLYLDGATRLFEQPEFSDVAKAREVFGLLEERDRVIDLLRCRVGPSETPHASVLIGSESQSHGLEEISVVAAPYRVGEKTVGRLGVLGPRRMPYSRLTAVVDYTANMLSRFLTRLAG